MINKQTIETQLDCKATAALSFEIVADFQAADKSMAELLKDLEEKDETKNKPHSSS